jgi:ABC-type branched-subunit amino acid transport system substrate-binding protein
MSLFPRPKTAVILLGIVVSAHAQTLKIGVQIPLTGERADVGQIMKNALDMAAGAINAKGGAKVELNYADDKSENDGAVEALNKLIAGEPVAVIGEINSPLVLASKPIVEKTGIPYMTGGTSPRTTDQSQWIYRAGASDALLTALMARYAEETLGLKSVAVIHDKTGVHNQRSVLLTNILGERYHVTPVADVAWAPGATDFQTLIDQLKAKSPQLILALGETPEGGPLMKQLKASGITAQLIAHRDFGVRKALDDAAGGAEGALIFTEYSPDLQDRFTRDWAAAYQQKYSSAPNVIAAQYYDALILLAEAAKSGASRTGIKSGLDRINNFKGVLADYTFDAGHDGVHRILVGRVVAGKLTSVASLTE